MDSDVMETSETVMARDETVMICICSALCAFRWLATPINVFYVAVLFASRLAAAPCSAPNVIVAWLGMAEDCTWVTHKVRAICQHGDVKADMDFDVYAYENDDNMAWDVRGVLQFHVATPQTNQE